MPTPPYARFGVVIPVKPPAHAKSRLGGVGDEARQALAVAFALDTVTATLACDRVASVLVVTDDHRFAAPVRRLGARVIPDGTAGDLNGSLEQGAAELRRHGPRLHLAALCADLPALRPEHLDLVLATAPSGGLAFVADAEGLGTTLVTAPDLSTFRPRFGPRSRAAHLAAGGLELDVEASAALRRDVDTPSDLHEALRLGVGPHTARVSAELFGPARAAAPG
ncbi:MAG: 2-phospho-L-lactate guanylyltransferase [Actinomycetes bacterium]